MHAFLDTTVNFMKEVVLNLCVSNNFFKNIWIKSLAPYDKPFLSAEDAENLAFPALNRCEEAGTAKDEEEEKNEGEYLLLIP